MRSLLPTVALVLAAAALTACGDDSDDRPDSDAGGTPAAESNSEPPTVLVTVNLRDSAPLEVFNNSDDFECSTVGIDEIFDLAMQNPAAEPEDLAAMVPPVTVTLRDADGGVIGVEELDRYGGEFDKGTGCLWPVQFGRFEASDFYQVTVTKGDYVKTQEAAGGPDNVTIDVAL